VIDYGARGQVRVYVDAETLAKAAAGMFAEVALHAQDGRPVFVALSGGSTPRRMGELLASPLYRDSLPWGDLEIFWGDERWVPEESDESNFGTARRTFLDHVSVEPSRIHPFPTNLDDPMVAAERYAAELRAVFGETGDVPRFDLILLGMGDDGHTASLFPGTEVIHERERLVVAHYVPKLHAVRLTLTPPVINNAKQVTFLVSGTGKAATLAKVLEGPINVDELPSQVVRPTDGELSWLVDEAAAAQLRREQV
jgi:6-phosphogluconolactonase